MFAVDVIMEERKYTQEELERLVKEATRHGAVFARLTFDAHGRDGGKVKSLLVDFIARLAAEKGAIYCVGTILPPLERPAEQGEAEVAAEGGQAAEGAAGVVEGEQAVDGGNPAGGAKVFTTSAEVEVLADSFSRLLNFCLRYGPVGVEIVEPGEVRLGLDEAQSLLLDASQSVQEFSATMLKRVMKPEDFAALRKRLEERSEAGKKLLEKAG
ncbi:MAG: hypothetical protein AABW54_04210 [Candidatus Micrarchaeota archaeon]